MPIKGLTDNLRMPRLGKIRLGEKLTNNRGREYPSALDHFGLPDELIPLLGEKPTELEIMFPVEDEDIFASTWFRAYTYTNGLVCKGDGEYADRTVDVKKAKPKGQSEAIEDNPMATHDTPGNDQERRRVLCRGQQCPDYIAGRCKQNMMLQFLLPKVPGVGIWQIDTSSFNSIKNIWGGVALVRGYLGRASRIPLTLKLEPLEVIPKDGPRHIVHVLTLTCPYSLAELPQYAKLTEGIPQMTSAMLPEPDDEIPYDLYLNQEGKGRPDVDTETGEIKNPDTNRSNSSPVDESPSSGVVSYPSDSLPTNQANQPPEGGLSDSSLSQYPLVTEDELKVFFQRCQTLGVPSEEVDRLIREDSRIAPLEIYHNDAKGRPLAWRSQWTTRQLQALTDAINEDYGQANQADAGQTSEDAGNVVEGSVVVGTSTVPETGTEPDPASAIDATGDPEAGEAVGPDAAPDNPRPDEPNPDQSQLPF